MRIKKSVSKNSVSYSVIENVRDINGKSTAKVVEALGNEKEIREKHPCVDPEEWARAYAKKLTEERKQKSAVIIAKYNPRKWLSATSDVYTMLVICFYNPFIIS
ncbi:hypothetical protein P5G51_008285 [Virgibacillus sp. 179-BFC.A HS]|uniref:Transposase n=1 Tax=Tigheibacillus jepli TaxID=3035914 RepID=A0ABU5CIP5_9BACI|nr:hypothetical protein [Virgibacillus sp. 179-BFC.A HS]MDY0405398.1 hypothetical protein [Virgibacillus sp. 179-BFC.A HS]